MEKSNMEYKKTKNNVVTKRENPQEEHSTII